MILLIAQMSKHASIILCVDNTGTQNALINGTATNQVVNQMVATFWQVAARNNISVWVERVDSPTNIADAPSRKCGSEEATNTFVQNAKRLPLPKQFVQIIRTPEALRAAQYCIPPRRVNLCWISPVNPQSCVQRRKCFFYDYSCRS